MKLCLPHCQVHTKKKYKISLAFLKYSSFHTNSKKKRNFKKSAELLSSSVSAYFKDQLQKHYFPSQCQDITLSS